MLKLFNRILSCFQVEFQCPSFPWLTLIGGSRSDGSCLRSGMGRTLASFCVYNWICVIHPVSHSAPPSSSSYPSQQPLLLAQTCNQSWGEGVLKMETFDIAPCLPVPFPSSSHRVCVAGGEVFLLPSSQLQPLSAPG